MYCEISNLRNNLNARTSQILRFNKNHKMKITLKIWLALILMSALIACSVQVQESVDLSKAKILISTQIKSPIKETAKDILVEEIEKRTALPIDITNNWDAKTTIALALANENELVGTEIPTGVGKGSSALQKEGYRIFHENNGDKNTIWVIGADARGVLYGIGKLLRSAKMSNGSITIDSNIDFSETPEYALRGHQFGYRNTANSWDAWTVAQFDQHFTMLNIGFGPLHRMI